MPDSFKTFPLKDPTEDPNTVFPVKDPEQLINEWMNELINELVNNSSLWIN